MSENTALAKNNPVNILQSFLKTREKNLAQYVAGRIKPDVLIRLALFEFSQNEWLRKCSPESIYTSLITSAQLGLEIGKAKSEGFLVPFGGQCTFVPGYRGLIKLALRSKGVKSIYSHLVYAMDEFVIELGSEPRVVHRPSLDDARENPADLLGAYAIAHLENGSIDVEWMSITALQKVRAASASKNSGPYKEWAEEMFRKAPIRRLAKRLPMGEDFYRAVETDEAFEADKPAPRYDMDGTIEAEVVEEKSGGLADRVKNAARGDS